MLSGISRRYLAQQELLEEAAAQQQKLMVEFSAALERNQTLWADQGEAIDLLR
jgi:hypothetical protein